MDPERSGHDGDGDAAGAAEIGALVLHVGDRRLALASGEVDEVVRRPARVARVPGAPRWLRGIVNARGRLLTLVDVQDVLDARATHDGPDARVVVVERGPFLYGLLVDEVEPVAAPIARDREPGVISSGERSWPVLDWRALLETAAHGAHGEVTA